MREEELWAEYPQANYIAIDRDGTRTLFACKPYLAKNMWMVKGGWVKIVGKNHDIDYWKNSLIAREEK